MTEDEKELAFAILGLVIVLIIVLGAIVTK